MHQVMQDKDVHSIIMQEQHVTMHSSIIQCMYVCQELLTCITSSIIKHNCNICLETVAKLSKWFLLYCTLRILAVVS